MSFNLRNPSLLTVQDYTPREFQYLLDLARDLKRAKYAGTEQKHLEGKEICLIFEKTSTRTRCSFEVACYDQGAHVTYLDPHAGVPVFNGLTDKYHPTQMLADVMTMGEHCDKPLSAISYAFIGDTRNNMGLSLMIVGCLLGMDVRLCGPHTLWPSDEFTSVARKLQSQSRAKLTITDDPAEAVSGVDFIQTDIWVSMGEPKEVWKDRIRLLKPYQVTRELMESSGNPHVKLMHCLPAFHDTETTMGKQIAATFGLSDGLEVTNDVFESEYNIAFEQAENRMHTMKAMLVATLGD